MCGCKDKKMKGSNTDPNLGYSWRKISKGGNYEHLFGVNRDVSNKDVLIYNDFELNKVIDLVAKTAMDYRRDTEALAEYLNSVSKDRFDLYGKIWTFMYHHFQYKEDDEEQIRTPLRSWRDRHTGIDCDCYAAFISSILLNLDIDHKLRVAKYKIDKPFQHIYVVAEYEGKEVIIDPVLHEFNKEKVYVQNIDKNMSLRVYQLQGVDENTFDSEFENNYSGYDTEDLLDILNGGDLGAGSTKKNNIFKKAANAVKKVVTKSNASGKDVKPKQSLIKKVVQGGKKLVKFAVKVQPIVIASRNGLLLFFMVVSKISKLLYPAIKYSSEAEASKDGIDAAQFKKSKDGLKRIEKMFVNKMQGKKEALYKAITKGATKGKSGMKGIGTTFSEEYLDLIREAGEDGVSDLEGGLGEPTTMAAAGTVSLPPIIATIVEMVTAGLLKMKPEQIKDFAKGLMKEANESPEATEVTETLETDQKLRENGADAGEGSGDADADGSGSSSGGVMNWVRENPAKTGLGVAALVLTAIGVKKFVIDADKEKPQQRQEKEKPLSGTQRKRTKKQQDSFQLY